MALIDPVCTCDPLVDVSAEAALVFDPVCTIDTVVDSTGSEGAVKFDPVCTIDPAVEITGQFGSPPPTITVSVTGATTLRVNFSEAMADTAELDDPASYSVTRQTEGAVGVAVSSVTREAVTYPTYVDLVTTEHTDGADYEFNVGSGVVDQQGDPVEDPEPYVGQGVQPQISSVVALNATKVRVTFDEPMDLNGGELTEATNYTITPQTVGAAAVVITSVTAGLGSTPSHVDLDTSEHTEGATYQVAVVTSGEIRDAAYNPIDPAGASDTYIGEGEAPTLVKVEAVSSTRVDLVFSETMRDNATIRDPAQYVWDNGLTTLAVLELDGDTVKLVTTEQTEGLLYTLTIS